MRKIITRRRKNCLLLPVGPIPRSPLAPGKPGNPSLPGAPGRPGAPGKPDGPLKASKKIKYRLINIYVTGRLVIRVHLLHPI